MLTVLVAVVLVVMFIMGFEVGFAGFGNGGVGFANNDVDVTNDCVALMLLTGGLLLIHIDVGGG